MSEENKSLAIIQKDITDVVSQSVDRLQNEGLILPSNYNYSNALKSAFFKLQETKDKSGKLALDVCSKTSVANALLDMVTQGLSPAKTQCYFIVYGNKLQLNRSYFGTQTVLKRLSGVADMWANIIYDGDDFVIEVVKGREKLVSHETKFENRDNNIKGAYAIVELESGEQVLTTMTKAEIDTAWSQTKTGGAVQKKYPQEMAKRTVINRAAKAFINTSDDSDLLIDSINNTTANEYEDNEIKHVDPIEELNNEVELYANKTAINFEEVTTIPENTTAPGTEIIDQKETQETLFNNLKEVTDEKPQQRKRDF